MRKRAKPFDIAVLVIIYGIVLLLALVLVVVLPFRLDLAGFLIAHLVTTLFLIASRLFKDKEKPTSKEL